MEVRILGCDGGLGPGSRMSSALVDDVLLVDAGHLAVAGLERVEALLLTHAHMDHVLHLPMFLTGGLARDRPTIQMYGEDVTLDRVRRSLLADLVYPDHAERMGPGGRLVGAFHAIAADESVDVLGYRVTPIRMVHDYPCLSYAIRPADGGAGAIVSGDTSDSRPLWAFARAHDWVRRITVEVSFPDALRELAAGCGHLTPAMLAEQLGDFVDTDVAIDVVHLKPEVHAELRAELAATFGDRVRIAAAEDVLLAE